jgi:hypothetical protein
MKSSYSLLSKKEPTDKQLHQLMKYVLIDVKKRSKIAKKRLQTIQNQDLKNARRHFKIQMISHEK